MAINLILYYLKSIKSLKKDINFKIYTIFKSFLLLKEVKYWIIDLKWVN